MSEQALLPCMLSQSFGVSHMKFGTEPELRSLTSAQSVPVQVELLAGFARPILLHRVALVSISWNETNGLCMNS